MSKTRTNMRIRLVLLVYLFAFWQSTLVTCASDGERTQYTIWIEAFLNHPDNRGFEFAKEAAEYVATDAKSRLLVNTQLRQAFMRNWIHEYGQASGLTLKQFTELVRLSRNSPFGAERRELVDIIAKPTLPRAWRDRSFLIWLRHSLPQQVGNTDTVEVLLKKKQVGDPQMLIRRYAFLHEIISSDNAHRVQRFFRGILGDAEVKEMPQYCRPLAEFSDLERWSNEGETDTVRRILGNRLFSLSPEEWHDAGKLLEDLIRSSSRTPQDFLSKAVKAFRADKKTYIPNNARVLSVLCDDGLIDDTDLIYRLLEPSRSIEWFRWLHEHNILQKLHAGHLDLMKRSLRTVKDFDKTGNFSQLFAYLRDHYYKSELCREEVFEDLFRPHSGDEWAKLVFSAVEELKLIPNHRMILGIDLLSVKAGRGLKPGWPGATKSRLQIAVDIYLNLLDKRTADPEVISEHLESPLLGAIVKESIVLLRGQEEDMQRIVSLLTPIAERISEYREMGVNTSTCGPLRNLNTEVRKDVEEALDMLTDLSVESRSSDQNLREAVQRFVRSLTLSLRLTPLIEQCLEDSPKWLEQARIGLRDRVFGLGSTVLTEEVKTARFVGKSYRSTLYWESNKTTFLARMLLELDLPLRECLVLDRNGRETELFWREIYLPLVGVHGFLKKLKTLAREEIRWPHLAWVLAEQDVDKQQVKFRELFGALATERWVDADSAVLDLAQEHRRLVLKHNVWCVDPDTLFAGAWSINANFRVWREMLRSATPPENVEWKLELITNKALEQLRAGQFPIGPTFPLSSTIPEQDTFQSVWDHASWVLDLVDTTEWQTGYYSSEKERELSWQQQITVVPSRDPPFHCELDRGVRVRKVDGHWRDGLACLLLERLDGLNEPITKAIVAQRKLAANVIMFLPNHKDNLIGPPDSIKEYHVRRQSIYGRFYRLFKSMLPEPSEASHLTGSRCKDLVDALRIMMWLDVSCRSNLALDPSFSQVLQEYQEYLGGNPALELAIKEIRLERATLIEVLASDRTDAVSLARLYLREAIGFELEDLWGDEERELRNRRWAARLQLLNESQVLQILRMRKHLRILLSHLLTQDITQVPKEQLMEDIACVYSLLDHTDFLVSYSNQYFDEKQIEAYLRQAKRSGSQRTTTSSNWLPALVVLSLFDSDLQAETADFCSRIGKITAKEGNIEILRKTEERIQKIRMAMFSLNDAIFQTMQQIVKRHDSVQIFGDFQPHVLEWSVLDFRLLTDSVFRETASSQSLSRDCFQGVLTNLRIVNQNLGPSDELMHRCLYSGSINQCLQVRVAPSEGRQNKINIDRVVRLADQWIDLPNLPLALRNAATQFLKHGNEQLFTGAASVSGIISALEWIVHQTSAPLATKRYRSFYESRLTTVTDKEVAFSDDFYRAMAKPFFPGLVASQQRDIEKLLMSWRKYLGQTQVPAESQPSGITQAYGEDFGRVISNLVHGVGRVPQQDYIWQSVDALVEEKGIRSTPPTDFYQVVKWWRGLSDKDDPPIVRRLFFIRSAMSMENGI